MLQKNRGKNELLGMKKARKHKGFGFPRGHKLYERGMLLSAA